MKTLYCLRHAHTEAPSYEQTDQHRSLTDAGRMQAENIGSFMMQQQYKTPDLILCSPAVRTRQTLDGIQSICGLHINAKIDYPKRLYGATKGDHISFIQAVPDTVHTLMIIAHNPGIYELVVALSARNSSEDMPIQYAPSTLSVLSCPTEKWADIKLYENNLLKLFEA